MTKRELQNKYLNTLRENAKKQGLRWKETLEIYKNFLKEGGNEQLWEKITDIRSREEGIYKEA